MCQIVLRKFFAFMVLIAVLPRVASAAETAADLSALTLSTGPLSPAFHREVTAYSSTALFTNASVTVDGTAVSASAPSIRARLNGAPSLFGLPQSLPLRAGFNQIQVRVTAAGAPLGDSPLSANSLRNLAVSSAGAVTHCPLSSSGSLPALPAESQSGVVGVASGSYGEYALKNDGTLIRLSGGTIPAAAQPVSPATAVASLAVGGSHALLLRADGTTYAWGSNTYGQTTIPADAQSGVVAVACGANHALALRADGLVVAWGQNTFDQAFVPANARSDIVAISAQGSNNLALRADGLVISWGSGSGTPPPAAQTGIVAIATSGSTAYALTPDGAVVAWVKYSGFVLSPPPEFQSNVIAIAAGPDHLLALKSDGGVVAWGTSLPPTFPSPLIDAPVRSYYLFVERRLPAALSALVPALGIFTNAFAPEIDSYALAAATPYRGLALHGLPFANHARLAVRSGAEAFQPVVAGQTLAYMQYGGAALRADGSVLSWGSITAPPEAQSDVVSLAAGSSHVLALKPDGSVVAWGQNAYSQNYLPTGLRAIAIAASDTCNMVLQPGGTPLVFGGSASAMRTPPADAVDLVAIAAGSSHAMGLRRDGRVVVWGSSGTLTTVPADAQAGVVAIASAANQCVALRTDGRVVSWGAGDAGLGTVPPAATYGVVAIACGRHHAVALRADGSVIAWGRSYASLPAGFLPDIAAVVAGSDSTVFGFTSAILRDGSLVQLEFPPDNAPAELSTGTFALPLHSLLPLSPGANALELRASSRTGTETRTYSITVQRSAAPELGLRTASSEYLFMDGGFGGFMRSAISLGYLRVGGPPLVTPWVLANTGSADLVVDAGFFSGPNAAEFALSGISFPLTLGPGEEIAFDSVATPAAIGFRNATLVLSANLPHGEPYTLPLRAEGLTAASVLASWRSSRFTSAELNDPALEATVWGNLADPDGDGLPNLLEHALNTAPKTPGLQPAATIDVSTPGAPRLTLTYTRVKRSAAAGIVYRAEWSDTLAAGSWSEAGVTEQVTPVTVPLSSTLETVVASVAADSPCRFLRLRVTAP